MKQIVLKSQNVKIPANFTGLSPQIITVSRMVRDTLLMNRGNFRSITVAITTGASFWMVFRTLDSLSRFSRVFSIWVTQRICFSKNNPYMLLSFSLMKPIIYLSSAIPAVVNILSGIVSHSIMECINAGDIDSAIEKMACEKVSRRSCC